MNLEPIQPTESVLANQIAAGALQQIVGMAQRIIDLRTNGVTASEAQPAGERDGRAYPAQPARTAVSAAAINAAFGVKNCAVLDKVKADLGL